MVLELSVTRLNGGAQVVLSGELDISEASRVERQLRFLEESRPDPLVIDLRGLRFMDSTGLRLIVTAHQRSQSDGRRLLVVRGPDAVHRVFSATRLDERLEFVDGPPS